MPAPYNEQIQFKRWCQTNVNKTCLQTTSPEWVECQCSERYGRRLPKEPKLKAVSRKCQYEHCTSHAVRIPKSPLRCDFCRSLRVMWKYWGTERPWNVINVQYQTLRTNNLTAVRHCRLPAGLVPTHIRTTPTPKHYGMLSRRSQAKITKSGTHCLQCQRLLGQVNG